MNKKILIVSAFGRGHWLAVQLKRLGLQVVLMDVTEKLGTWIPEEAEGPFGFFYSDKILESQIERLHEDDALIEAPTGFQVWLADGPVELKGATTKHRLEKLKISEEILKYLLGGGGLEKIKSMKFQTKWLALFAHCYLANKYYPTVEVFHSRNYVNLLATFFTRFASRIGHEKSLQWVERQGIEVLRGTDVIDISMRTRNLMKGVEYKTLQTESTQVYESDLFVWCLTSEETAMFGGKPLRALYPHGALEPIWYWARYRARLSEGLVRESLPTHSILIDDLSAPWTHENHMIMARTGSRDLFDIWVRLPNVQRFNKDYLLLRGKLIHDRLKKRLVQTEIEIVNQPIGFDHTFNQIGPARHPIYDPQELSAWKPADISNIYFDSPEQWPLLGLNGMFEHQLHVSQSIELWWKNMQLKDKKEVEA